MKPMSSSPVVLHCLLLGAILVFVLGACTSGTEEANTTSNQPTQSSVADSIPSETPVPEEITQLTPAPTEKRQEPTPTPEPSPTPTRLPADPWGRMIYSLPELAGPITASNLGIEQLARWGMGDPYSMAFSPDGELIGIETTTGKYIYNAYSTALIPFEEALWKRIFPAGSMLLTHGQGVMLLYKDGGVILKDERISPYALSPGQRWVAGFEEEQGTLRVFDTQNGQEVSELDMQIKKECLGENWEGKMSPSVSYLGIMESGKSLAISCGDNSELALFSINGEKILIFDLDAAGLESSPGHLQFSPDASLLAGFTSDESKVHIWNTNDGSFMTTLGGDNYPHNLKDIWFSPDNSKILAGFSTGR